VEVSVENPECDTLFVNYTIDGIQKLDTITTKGLTSILKACPEGDETTLCYSFTIKSPNSQDSIFHKDCLDFPDCIFLEEPVHGAIGCQGADANVMNFYY